MIGSEDSLVLRGGAVKFALTPGESQESLAIKDAVQRASGSNLGAGASFGALQQGSVAHVGSGPSRETPATSAKVLKGPIASVEDKKDREEDRCFKECSWCSYKSFCS